MKNLIHYLQQPASMSKYEWVIKLWYIHDMSMHAACQSTCYSAAKPQKHAK